MKWEILVVIVLAANAAFAQVHVRENVTISPRPANSVQDVATPVITIIPSVIGPGDTANIYVNWENPNEPMLVDIVEAGIMSGEDYGMLVDYDGPMGTYLYPVASPSSSSSYTEIEFWFIANDSIDVDSARVEIRVGVGVFQWDSSLPVGKGNLVRSLTAGGGTTGAGSQNVSGKATVPKGVTTRDMGTVSATADAFRYTPYGVAWLTITKKQGGPNLNFPRYSQGDSLWADSTYDDDIVKKENGQDSTDVNGDTLYYTIRNRGCALSEIAWILSAYGYTINPGQLNEWMNSKSYDDGGYSTDGDVNWDAISDLSRGKFTATVTDNKHFGNLNYAHDVSDLDNYLDNGDFVMAQVDNEGDKHWVVVEPKTSGEYPIVDAGYKDRATMEVYNNNVWKYVVVSRKKGK
jgi:hypothetical protein